MPKAARAIDDLVPFEIPPGQRLDLRLFVRLERVQFLLRQGLVVNAGVLNFAGQPRAMFAARADVSQPEHGDMIVHAQQVDVLGGVIGVRLGVAIDADVIVVVGDSNLHERLGVGRLGRVAALVALGALEKVAAGHPSTAGFLAQHDRIKPVAALDRQSAAPLLSEVRRANPGDKRFAHARLLFGGKKRGRARQEYK